MHKQPLEGMTVLEIANWVQGPLAAHLLGNLGATVIKVERPGSGDPARGLQSLYGASMMTRDGRAMLWELCNRNKQSVCLDLRRPEGHDAVHRLAARADVFVTNMQRDTLENVRCTAEELFGVNEKLVYALGGGLTVNGPLANAPAQDTVAMAQSGFMLTAGTADGEPVYPPGALADVTAASSIASGVVTALLARERHGATRQLVTTSLVQAAMWTQMLGVSVPANTGERLKPYERGKAANPAMAIYEAGDGRWLALGVVALTNRFWRDICEAIGTTHWSETTDWGESWPNRARAAHQIAAALQDHFLSRPAQEWVDRLRAYEVPCSLITHPAELPDDEGVQADRIVVTGADGLRFVSNPFHLTGVDPSESAPAPALGQDTAPVLASAGYSEGEVAELFESGTAW